jgi:TolB protein
VYDLGLTEGEVTISGQTNITDTGPLSGAYTVFRPDWAKTGDGIAVVVFETGTSFRDIWVIDLGSPGNPTNVTQSPDVSENMPSWSPDDLQIVFRGRNSKNRASIFVMNADGSGATEIGKPKGGMTQQRSPDWRRNQ